MDDGPDIVLTEQPGELIGESLDPKGKRRRGREKLLLAELAGFERLMFRTALIRPSNWRPGATGPKLWDAHDVAHVCTHLTHLDHERVIVLCLDAKGRLIAIHEASVGGMHGAALTPRDAYRVPLLVGADAAVLVHNHPSGDPSPSPQDVALTRAVAAAYKVLGMKLVDHVVVARGGGASMVPSSFSSLRELGLFS